VGRATELTQLNAYVFNPAIRLVTLLGPDAQPRFLMLETIREYALERLEVSGEAEAIRQRHAIFFLALAEAAAPQFYGPEQVAWLNRIESEHDNMRAAQEWLAQRGEVDTAMQLAGALRYFWFVRGYHSEGSEQLLRILARPEAVVATAARVKALNAAGYLQWVRGNQDSARTLLEEALTIARAVDDRPGAAFALCSWGL
jgi:hypothetical protein